jgi:hypothetical protein
MSEPAGFDQAVEVLAYANLINGSDHKKFGEFEPIEVELAFKALLRARIEGEQ